MSIFQLIDLLAWICVISFQPGLGIGRANFYIFVTILALFADGILLILIFSRLCESVPHFVLVQMAESAVLWFFYFIGFCLMWAGPPGGSSEKNATKISPCLEVEGETDADGVAQNPWFCPKILGAVQFTIQAS